MRPRAQQADAVGKVMGADQRRTAARAPALRRRSAMRSPAAGASPRSCGGGPCARSARRPKSASVPSSPSAARMAARSAGGRNRSVSTPLRSTVTLSSGAPSSTRACFSAALTAIKALASRIARLDQAARDAVLRDQVHVGAARGQHHRQPEAAAQPGGGNTVGIDVMGVDRVEAVTLGQQAADTGAPSRGTAARARSTSRASG